MLLTRLLPILFAAAAVPLTAAAEEAVITPGQRAFFDQRIRPVLVAKCYSCHSATAPKVEGRLLLDTREGMRRGGTSGPAVVPGDLISSLLISAIRWHDPEHGMPPQKKGGRLASAVIADFEQWVINGAPDPRVETPAGGEIIRARSPRPASGASVRQPGMVPNPAAGLLPAPGVELPHPPSGTPAPQRSLTRP